MSSCNKKKQNIDRSLVSLIHHEAIWPQRPVNKFLKRRVWLILLLAGLMFCRMVMGQPSTKQTQKKPEPLPEMSAKVYEKVSPVTAIIIYDKRKKNGSGVVVGLTEKGRALILTACHVVAMNFEETDPNIALEFYKDILIKTNADIKFVRASVVQNFVDRSNDLALLATVESVPIDKVIHYANTNKVNPGEKVAAFGYPTKDKLSQTVGRITRLEDKYLVFDAKIAPGNSGGPLIDKFGRMIGMSTFVEGENEGHAVNINLVASVVENWLKGIKLKERWKHQKYTTGFEKTIKNWPFIASGVVAVGGGIAIYSANVKKNGQAAEDFPLPPGRPGGN